VANYLRKAVRYVVDYPRGEIATWVSYHTTKSPCGYSTDVAKIQVFL
jgi:hypothetical protein